MQIPLQAEQELISQNVERLGAGLTVTARVRDRERIENLLDQLVANSRYAEAAQRFAARYKDFDPKVQQAQMLQRVLELLEQPAAQRLACTSTS